MCPITFKPCQLPKSYSPAIFHSFAPAILNTVSQERKGHINLRKMPGTPAGCPWDTRRDKRGSTGRCPRDFLLIAIEKRTEKAIFPGTPAGCPRDTRPSRGFQKFYVIFSYVPFPLPSFKHKFKVFFQNENLQAWPRWYLSFEHLWVHA